MCLLAQRASINAAKPNPLKIPEIAALNYSIHTVKFSSVGFLTTYGSEFFSTFSQKYLTLRLGNIKLVTFPINFYLDVKGT